MNLRLLVVTGAVLISPLGCSEPGGAMQQGAGGRYVDSAGGAVALELASGNYRGVALPATGAIAGKIRVTAADDTVAVRPNGQRTCADSSAAPAEAVLVWVDSIAAGKSLPLERRSTLSITDCQFEPQILAVATGTTINLFSGDRATYTTRFFREGDGTAVAEIHTVDDGQVVPSERIAERAGLVAVRRAEQPWARAFVAVFDHPYYAVTEPDGSFRIDSLPPGTYTVKLWHAGMEKPSEQRVTVTAGGSGRLDLTLAP